MKQYDYIFTGSGLAALMVVYRMLETGKYDQKKILLLDENPVKTNDRTWCFWEKKQGRFDKIVSGSWKHAVFADAEFSRVLDFSPYVYKMIHGIDFYDHVFSRILTAPNVSCITEKVLRIIDEGKNCRVITEQQHFNCNFVLNSIFDPGLPLAQKKYPILLQHFIGWFIKTEIGCFDPGKATFMDFSVPQRGNTRFMYVLPFSPTEALVEYTLFSATLLSEDEYEKAIGDYMQNLGVEHFTIVRKERGSIPMTAFKFWKNNSSRLLNIGSAGGWTKASTGFTFRNCMKKSAVLVEFLQREPDLRKFHKTSRFWLYDLLLLDILDKHNEKGSSIFSAMFKKGDAQLILKFLDEETSIWEDIQVILKCPKQLFIKALCKRMCQKPIVT